MDVLSAVLLALLLIGANAFFVGAEFALISARRDRLEALAEQGKATAVTVIRAGEQLPAMLTGAQLGVTVSSILLGRVGEPAVVKLLQLSFGLAEEHRFGWSGANSDVAGPAVPGLRAPRPAVHRVLQQLRQRDTAAGWGAAEG